MNKIDKIMHRLIKGQNPAIIKIALSRKPSTERSVAIGLMAIQHKNPDKNVSSQATAETSTNDTIPPGDQDIEEDGGPGSGNWGHKGRPGQVGGSGKGGGKQYRGGRGDITYVSSKHDWLNGLTGEKQHEAQSFMKRMKQAFPLGEEKNRSTEENILRETEPGILKTKKQLTDYMAEARSWDEKAGKLIDENLDDTDKKYIETLANKYGMTFSGGVMLPDESDIGDWDEDDQHFWYDLKSKAMGGPTSGRDAPDELQYEAGIKERPSEKPWWLDEEGAHKSEINAMKTAAQNILGGASGISRAQSQADLNAIEKSLFKEAIMDPSKRAYLTEYMAAKTKATFDQRHGDLSELPGYGSLSAVESSKLMTWKSTANIVENGLSIAETIQKYTRHNEQRYFDEMAILAKALGSDISYSQNTVNEGKNLKKQARADRYNQNRKNNVVIIEGDSFSEKINSMRHENGSYTEHEYTEIGKEVIAEYEKQYQSALHSRNEAQKGVDAAAKALEDVFDPKPGETTADWRSRLSGYSKALDEAQAKLDACKNEMNQVVPNVLRRVRKLGGATDEELKTHLPGRSSVRKHLVKAFELYPSEWFKASSERGTITTKKTNRGYCDSFDNGTIAISGYSELSMFETAVHELGHRFENSVPGILEAERAFYERRTQGEKLQRLRDVTGNSHYKYDELTKVDQFTDPYMGKDYSGNAFELVSMGFAQAFTDPAELMKDKDYASFILGILATA